MRLHASVVSVAFALALAIIPVPAPAATFYLTTGLGTNVTTIDAETPAIWGFFTDETYSQFAGAVFAMKYDGTTSLGVKMELLDISQDAIATVSYANVVAYIGAGGEDQYAKFTFLLASLYSLPTGYHYVRVSLDGEGDPTGQSYSIRGIDEGATLALTENADTIVVTETVSAVTTPEPASAFMIAAGLLGLGLARRHAQTAAA